jgi:DNA repair protein RecO (recombination protein O)
MNHISTKAIILKRIDYGEADRIITVLTRDKGKLSLLGKGTRKSKSKLAGGLELFSVADITYIDGKSDLKIIIATKLDTYFSSIVENIDTTMLAYEFLRLINVYTEDDADESYFSLIHGALLSLHEKEVSRGHIEAWYMTNLLINSGHGLNVNYDVAGNAFTENQNYHFSYEDMCFFPHQRGEFKPRHIKLLKLLGKVGKPAHLLRVKDADELIEDILILLRRSITT